MAIHPLLPKLRQMIDLSDEERRAVEAVPVRRERIPADQAILREGARATRCFGIEAGFACTSKIVANGGRQIIALHIPGDLPDLTSLHLEVRDSDLWALMACDVAFLEHGDVLRLCAEQPRVGGALWRVTLVDGAVFREWVVNVGQRDGLARLSHLFCEMMVRMEAAGQARDGTCALPVTQDDLAEATGMSHVHVNRMLQELRRRKLLSFARGVLSIHDREGLIAVGDFQDDYLHLRPAA